MANSVRPSGSCRQFSTTAISCAPARRIKGTADDAEKVIPANHQAFPTAKHHNHSPISQRKIFTRGVLLRQQNLDTAKLTALDGRSARKTHMNWFYWDTAWSLFFSLVWFMTITQNPDARIADAHLRDEAFGG
jgi:hypothetical protein